MKVRNLEHEPHPPKCTCENWLQHWENNSGKKAGTCSTFGCLQKAGVGGHVQKRDGSGDSWYIIPICKGCNSDLGQDYEVKDDTVFTLVCTTDQCGLHLINKTLHEAGHFSR